MGLEDMLNKVPRVKTRRQTRYEGRRAIEPRKSIACRALDLARRVIGMRRTHASERNSALRTMAVHLFAAFPPSLDGSQIPLPLAPLQ